MLCSHNFVQSVGLNAFIEYLFDFKVDDNAEILALPFIQCQHFGQDLLQILRRVIVVFAFGVRLFFVFHFIWLMK